MSHTKLALIALSALVVATVAAAQTIDDACTVAGVSLAPVCVSPPPRTRAGYSSQADAVAALRTTQSCRAPREAPPTSDARSWAALGLPQPRAWMVWLIGIAAAAVIALRRAQGDGFWE